MKIVIKFGNSLRNDTYNWMLEIEQKTDLCLCLGTSLSGMNADRCAMTPAKKFKKNKEGSGTIMINLQKTKIDYLSTIRVWAKIDDAFKVLAEKLGLEMSTTKSFTKHEV